MSEVCQRLETVPRTDPAKGTLRFYADAARYVVDPVPYAVAKYRSADYAATRAGTAADRPLRCGRLRFPGAAGEHAAHSCRAPPSSSPTTWRRRSGAGTSRRRQIRSRASCSASSGSACCASSATRSRISISCLPCRRPTATRSSASILAHCGRRCTSCRRASTRSTSVPCPPRRRGARTSSSPGRWTGCRTKTACSISSATSCRSSARRNPGRR